MKFADTEILVFTKAAVPGRVKTRLTPYLSADRAAALAQQLQQSIIDMLTRASLADITLLACPDCTAPQLSLLIRRYSLECREQSGEDLGERMYRAAAEALQRRQRVILLGTDCAVMTADYVRSAIEQLQHNDAVIGPAEDGGYVLLGLKQAPRWLFSDIDWGTPRVLAQTVTKLRQQHGVYKQLGTLWDVDEPADYERYLQYIAREESDRRLS